MGNRPEQLFEQFVADLFRGILLYNPPPWFGDDPTSWSVPNRSSVDSRIEALPLENNAILCPVKCGSTNRVLSSANGGRQSFPYSRQSSIANCKSRVVATLSDLEQLAFLAAKHPTLIGAHQDLTRQAGAFSEPVQPTPKKH